MYRNTEPNYKHWLEMDLWTVKQGILLLLKLNKLSDKFETVDKFNYQWLSHAEKKNFDKYKLIWDKAEASLKTGKLKQANPYIYEGQNTEIYPEDFILWARSKNQEIPAELEALAKTKSIEPESETEAVGDDEIDAAWEATLQNSLPTILSELKQRNEAPYDGVLGCPPNSVTDNEREKFKSIRNRLLDEKGFTVADIHGLINDCNANSNSFSLIPDKLNQDVHFLTSLWCTTRKDEPQAEALADTGAGGQAAKPRKKLKPLVRETTEGLLLLYEMFKHYEVEYLDVLPAIQAWGKIINKEFTCDLISIVAETKKHILLSGGEKLDKADFLEKYRKRFK
jgi:hypothetical protein